MSEKGNETALSVIHGTTKNKAACTRLLDDLEERGFVLSAGVLFCVDGGNTIYHAISDKWSDSALILQCEAHKPRNVTHLLPQHAHAWMRRELNRAWATADVETAKQALRTLAAKIERTRPDTLASLSEGLTDTITTDRLAVPGALAKNLATSNSMESTVEIVKAHARNLKRWQTGDMRLRWATAGVLAAEAQYRRVKGYRQLDLPADAITANIHRRQVRLAGAS